MASSKIHAASYTAVVPKDIDPRGSDCSPRLLHLTKPIMRQTRNARCGVASFELVMSAPILMFLIAMMFTVYVATIKKSHLTMSVRHTPWLVRSNPKQADQRQEPFAVLNVSKSGSEVEVETTRVRTYQSWYPGVPRQVTWGNVVLTGSWDYRDVEFKEGGLLPIYPHIDVLGKMAAAQGGIQVSGGSIGQLNKLTRFPGLP